jgi:hypothetical protein
VLDRLRDAQGGEWTVVGGPVGAHDDEAVRVALSAMEREGLVERHPSDPARARLPAG